MLSRQSEKSLSWREFAGLRGAKSQAFCVSLAAVLRLQPGRTLQKTILVRDINKSVELEPDLHSPTTRRLDRTRAQRSTVSVQPAQELRYRFIDSLRGLSILLVVLYHGDNFFTIQASGFAPVFPVQLTNVLFRSGYYGVTPSSSLFPDS